MTPKRLIVIAGPTAVGKSPVAAGLARELRSEILTADSRQVYRKMDIGTAKPTGEGVSRHLIDLVDPDEPFSAGEYLRRAEPILRRLHEEGRVPIVEGGTGLYIRAVLRGLFEGPQADPDLRRLLLDDERSSPGYLYRALSEVDPASAGRIHPNDRSKLLRALEVFRLTGRPISEYHRRHRSGVERFWTLQIGLVRGREEIYRRIRERIDRQMAAGFLGEVRSLLEEGHSPELPSMRALGYRQMIPCVRGGLPVEEGVRRFKRETQRFAKRQLTWFRADPKVVWLDLSDREGPEEALKRIKALKSFQDML